MNFMSVLFEMAQSDDRTRTSFQSCLVCSAMPFPVFLKLLAPLTVAIGKGYKPPPQK
jgi:hypothetical protein